MINEPVRKWYKVLYRHDDIPDNFVDERFLSELRINLFLKRFCLSEIIIGAGCIYQQFCCVVIFLVMYFFLLTNWISPFNFSSVIFGVLSVCYAIFCALQDKNEHYFSRVLSQLRSGIVFFIFCFLLSPLLHSLLASVSTDSIYAMSIGFLFIHWIFFDYTIYLKGSIKNTGKNTIALSSSLLAALCLASRLPHAYHTFALLSSVVALLDLLPIFIGRMNIFGGWKAQLGFTVFCGLVFVFLTLPISIKESTHTTQIVIMWIGFLFVTVLINFLVPMLLMHLQNWRSVIHGPWDEAVLD